MFLVGTPFAIMASLRAVRLHPHSMLAWVALLLSATPMCVAISLIARG